MVSDLRPGAADHVFQQRGGSGHASQRHALRAGSRPVHQRHRQSLHRLRRLAGRRRLVRLTTLPSGGLILEY